MTKSRLTPASVNLCSPGLLCCFDVPLSPQITLNLHYLWIGPLQALVIIYFLLSEIGPSCLAGVAVVALMLPVQTWFGKLFGVFR